jgi:FtsP/CotA-like multicopper oxidase with cupredoxin domain
MYIGSRFPRALVWGIVIAGVLAVGAGPVAAQDADEQPCDFRNPDWRSAQTVDGVDIQAEPVCRPDNPATVAAVTKGTNTVSSDVLMRSGLHPDAVRKHTDRDDDGDPDVIEITLEVQGLNEVGGGAGGHAIAPGIEPAFWVFAPKTRGMVRAGTPAASNIRMPSPPLRVEVGDTVRITLENTHYFPHTIHLHGVDHAFEVEGAGNDGVPQVSEKPLEPGERRTYEFQARQPGTMFYHCHVVPDVHVMMGLNGMLVVEENRSDNSVQSINVGAGKVRHPSAAVEAGYDGEFDLHYQEVDAELHRIPQTREDPRRIAKAMNREYDRAEADPDFFLLNGRSFPYTVRESLVAVEPDSRYRLRTLNGGSETVSLHTHGHKVRIEAYDGVEVEEGSEITRDVVALSAAQRVDLTLNTTDDGRHSYGDGAWFFHDHREQGVTNDGIGPGGTITMITYPSYQRDNGMPDTNHPIDRFFDAAYYRGELPVWRGLDAERFGEPPGTDEASIITPEEPETRTATSTDADREGLLSTVGAVLAALAVGILFGGWQGGGRPW